MSSIQIHVIGSTDFHAFARQFFTPRTESDPPTKFHSPFYLVAPFKLRLDEVLIIEEYCGEMHQAEELFLKAVAKDTNHRLEKVQKDGFTIFLFSKDKSNIQEALSVLS